MPEIVRHSQAFAVTDYHQTKAQLLAWASQYSSCAFLDNNGYPSDGHTHECLAAAGAYATVIAKAGEGALQQLQAFIDAHKGQWLFGHVGYGLKGETEKLTTLSSPSLFPSFADVQFFVPEVVVKLQEQTVVVESLSTSPEAVWQQISSTAVPAFTSRSRTILQPLLSPEAYLSTIRQLQQHIQRGDCYEINFCLPFRGDDVVLQPVSIFQQLCGVSPMPFACFYRQQQHYLLCASPERFMQRKGSRIFSQPMKGTAPRHADPTQDIAQITALQTSPKERSENVMVADLVRNDLSKICREGTVQADVLFGVQTYPQVHQMVSTISGELEDDISFTDILRATFPMGSMTGAPKKRVLELIDQYEPCSRGLFSGSVGYISPEGDFDFNVVIRSLLYNAATEQLQYFAGSAITFYSQPQQEYEEVLLKTKAVRQVLEQPS